MSDSPFDRNITNNLEKPLSEDINRLQSQLDRSLRFFAKSLFSNSAGIAKSGFVQGGFSIAESSPQAMSVEMKAGLAFQDLPADVPADINGIVGLNDLESYKPIMLLQDVTIPISAAPALPNSRIDIIEVRADRIATDNVNRQVFNNTTQSFSPTLVDKTLQFLLDSSNLGTVADPAPSTAAISVKTGVPAVSPVAPAVTAGYIKVAEVLVGGGVTVITDADITDSRFLLRQREAKTIIIPAEAGQCAIDSGGLSSARWIGDGRGWRGRAGTQIYVTFPLFYENIVPGVRILNIEVLVDDDAAGPATLLSQLLERDIPSVGGSSPASDGVVSSGSGNPQAVQLTNINFNGGTNILEEGKRYFVETFENTAIRPTTLDIQGLRVTYDIP